MKKYVSPEIASEASIRFETSVSGGGVQPKKHVLVDPTHDDKLTNVNGTWQIIDPTHDDYWTWE